MRRAQVEWIGGLKDGEGKIVSTTTGALPELEVTWNGRVNEDQTITSPEELLAAAHASCYAMQFSSGLVGAGRKPDQMTVSAEVSFEIGVGIPTSALTVRVTVDGLTDDQIREIAERAKVNCPCRGRSQLSTSARPPRPGAPSGEDAKPHPQPKPRLSAGAAPHAARLSRHGRFEDLIDGSSARIASCRSACPTRRSTTTTGRRGRSAGA
jgi:osmotically inducible protein OsmC